VRRLFLTGPILDTVCLTGSDAHHVGYTLRAKAGDILVAVGADRQVAEMEVVSFTKDTVTLRRRAFLAADTEPPVEVGLGICLLKGEKMDFVVQKAVELGAAALHPIVTEHVVVRYDAKKAAAKTARWQKIADEAAKQCGRNALMRVEDIAPLPSLLQDTELFNSSGTAILFCYEAEEKQSMRMVLRTLQARRIVLIVGAEGGFSPAEAERIRAMGGQPVSLGRRILRAETAAITALAVTQYELGNLDL